MTLSPIEDKIVLKMVEAEETTKSGIILSGNAKEKPQVALVIAAGPGGLIDGNDVKIQVKPGDKVVYSKYSGTEIKLDGEEFVVVRQKDILAIVK
jgi:chaperonin GroES